MTGVDGHTLLNLEPACDAIRSLFNHNTSIRAIVDATSSLTAKSGKTQRQWNENLSP